MYVRVMQTNTCGKAKGMVGDDGQTDSAPPGLTSGCNCMNAGLPAQSMTRFVRPCRSRKSSVV